MTREIKWVPFLDPLPNFWNKMHEQKEDFVGEEWKEDEDENDGGNWEGKAIFTPFGVMALNQDASAAQSFDMWTMITNFDLEPNVIRIIERVPGIEFLFPLSRYQIRIGISNSGMFNSEEVRRNVERHIEHKTKFSLKNIELANMMGCDLQFVIQLQDKLESLKNSGKVWLLYALPNGSTELVMSDEYDEDFVEQENKLTICNHMVGGQLFSFLDGPQENGN